MRHFHALTFFARRAVGAGLGLAGALFAAEGPELADGPAPAPLKTTPPAVVAPLAVPAPPAPVPAPDAAPVPDAAATLELYPQVAAAPAGAEAPAAAPAPGKPAGQDRQTGSPSGSNSHSGSGTSTNSSDSRPASAASPAAPAPAAAPRLDEAAMPEYADNAAAIDRALRETEAGEAMEEPHYTPIPTLGQGFDDPGAVPLSLKSAVMLALKGNVNLKSAELAPELSAQGVRQARAAFDPTLSMRAAHGLINHSFVTGRPHGTRTDGNTTSAEVGLSEFLPTGTTLDLDAGFADRYSVNNDGLPERASSGSWGFDYGIGITQKLLKGRGLNVNLVSVNQARIDVEISRYQLQDTVEDVLQRTEILYWDLVLARQRVKIMLDSLRITKEQLRDTQERIRVGKLAEVEIAQARASVASAHVALIDAHNTYEQHKLELIALLNAPYGDKFNALLALEDMPGEPAVELDGVDAHVQLGLRRRPDINESRLRLRRQELTLVRTKNGLLPDLDLTISLDQGQADFRNRNQWGNRDDLTLGGSLRFSQPLGNRAARAAHRSAEISHEQARLAIDNLKLQIEVAIRSNYLNVIRYHKQIAATALATKQYELALQSQREKFKVGTTTNLEVATAEYNYTNSRLNAASAIISTIQHLTRLYRSDGSLLERRGVVLGK